MQKHISGRGKDETGANIFGVHLLQLKLWVFGFYYGRIDGHYWKLSHDAFIDLLKQEEKPKKHDDFILPIEDGCRGVNLPKTAELFAEYDEKVENAEKQEELLIEHIPDGMEDKLLQSRVENKPDEVADF